MIALAQESFRPPKETWVTAQLSHLYITRRRLTIETNNSFVFVVGRFSRSTANRGCGPHLAREPSGHSPGTWYLGFDLFGGSPSLSNTVSISSFNTTALLGSSSQSGNITGTLTQGPLVLTGSSPFNEYSQQITSKGTIGVSTDTVSFDFVMSANFGTQAQPDVFEVFMLDSNRVRFSTGDPAGSDAVVRGYSASRAETFGTPWLNTLTVTDVPEPVPEPATFLLSVVGLGWLSAVVKRSAA